MSKKRKKAHNRKNKQKRTFSDAIKYICAIIVGKAKTKDKMGKIFMTFLISTTLNISSLTLLLFAISTIYTLYNNWSLYRKTASTVITCVNTFITCILFLLFALILRGFAVEIEEEKNKNYIVAVLSALVAISALVVSIVSLLKT